MKFQITFKTPDSLDAITDYVCSEIEGGDKQDEMIAELEKFVSHWVKYGEMITIEFDTERKTCKVVEA